MSTLSRDDFRFFHHLRVRWSEVDPQNIVFNGHYLTYADVAITEYYRELGIKYPTDLSRDGSDFFVRKSTLEYNAPAYFDDALEIGIRTARFGNSSMSFFMGIWRNNELLTSGEVIYVRANTTERISQPLPDWLKEKITAYEKCPPQH
ncbi:thioesterase family protein [Ectopseudomonas mendocina]|uniref:Thioesterase family protein n=1 Tax=Ectopseudomonas mendocina TaxID=300 RepID=A0ABZ2RF32_ECTME